jgi:hypothetical protein
MLQTEPFGQAYKEDTANSYDYTHELRLQAHSRLQEFCRNKKRLCSGRFLARPS